MTLNYYFADNFFKKMTDLDSPRRNNDCYFYYYSTCTKGDSCTFRHEPSALGCETVCSFWKEGKCLNVQCNCRHMELRKNRKAIQCYWESQPGGCLKPHCPFLHQHERPASATCDDNININANNSNSTEETETSEEAPQTPPTQNGIEGKSSEKELSSQVDSLVVSFEEESDTESIPTKSPCKVPIRKLRVKTLEEIKLERIQEESAAYFAYSLDHPGNDNGEDLRRNLLRKRRLIQDDTQTAKKRRHNSYPESGMQMHLNPNIFTKVNFREQGQSENVSGILKVRSHDLLGLKTRGIQRITQKAKQNLETIKIKTLEEIRAEKKRRTELESDVGSTEVVEEISSTTKDEEENKKLQSVNKQKRKIKLLRLSSAHLKEMVHKDSAEKKDETPNSVTEDMEENRVKPADSVSGPQSVETKIETGNESIGFQEEMLLLGDDLDYEDDGLMNEIDSILSK